MALFCLPFEIYNAFPPTTSELAIGALDAAAIPGLHSCPAWPQSCLPWALPWAHTAPG